MSKKVVSTKNESARIFKSDIIESLSKVHFSVPIFIYVPIILFFEYLGFANGMRYGLISYSILGLLVWTATEYCLHRFVFHLEPKSKLGKRIVWMFHGVHHDFPQDSLRLVMPPGVSLPLAIVFYLIFLIIIPTPNIYPFFGAFLLGYLIYDITHYAIHHFTIKNKILLMIKKHHLKHHFQMPSRGFGVSSPLWDIIFDTNTKNKSKDLK